MIWQKIGMGLILRTVVNVALGTVHNVLRRFEETGKVVPSRQNLHKKSWLSMKSWLLWVWFWTTRVSIWEKYAKYSVSNSPQTSMARPVTKSNWWSCKRSAITRAKLVCSFPHWSNCMVRWNWMCSARSHSKAWVQLERGTSSISLFLTQGY